MVPELTDKEMEILINRIIEHGTKGLKGIEVFQATQLKYYIQSKIKDEIDNGIKIYAESNQEREPVNENEFKRMLTEYTDWYYKVFNYGPDLPYGSNEVDFKNLVDDLYHSFLTKDIFIYEKIIDVIDHFVKGEDMKTPFELGNHEIYFSNTNEPELQNNRENIITKIETLLSEIDRKKGWESIFFEEKEYLEYRETLVNFFSDPNFKIPERTIKTRNKTISKVSILFKGIHEHYSEMTGHLVKDDRFHQVVRILHEWKDKNSVQIYKAIYKG